MPRADAALYVRLPHEQAGRLDAASAALGVPKRELISGLVGRYVDPGSPASLEALRRLGASVRTGPLGVGHHSFRSEPREVLDLDGAAELLAVDGELVQELAERGELPGRRLGEHWRFSRRALVDWLAGAGEDPAPR